jgi:hypothetical protein
VLDNARNATQMELFWMQVLLLALNNQKIILVVILVITHMQMLAV